MGLRKGKAKFLKVDEEKESKTSCKHLEFESYVSVGRLTENEGDEEVKRFVADIIIRCKDCKEKMVFIGLEGGMNPDYPTTNIDGTELRAPLRPENKPKLHKNSNFVN